MWKLGWSQGYYLFFTFLCQLGPNTQLKFLVTIYQNIETICHQSQSNAKESSKSSNIFLNFEKHKLWIVWRDREREEMHKLSPLDPISWLIQLDTKVWGWDKVIWSDPCRVGTVSALWQSLGEGMSVHTVNWLDKIQTHPTHFLYLSSRYIPLSYWSDIYPCVLRETT